MPRMKPQLVADYACVTGEGPLWHPVEKRVYWVDIPTGRMFRYTPSSGQREQFYEGRVVGGFTIQCDGSLLLFMDKGTVMIWRDGRMTTVVKEIEGEGSSRFNDVIADPAGRVFCGTMSSRDHPGSLYRLDPDGSLSRILEGVGCSNGMGFTLDRRQMYHTDSAKREIRIYDYDPKTGSISNGHSFIRLPEGAGTPDGMTVDSEGYVWSAIWDGGCLLRFSPDGAEDMRMELPARKVSSVTFGGEDYGDIYATTAGGDKKETEGPGAGGLFRLRIGIKGLPEFQSRIGLGTARR